jgi:hypothetical protein
MADRISRRELNRATLARQRLLAREPGDPLEVVRTFLGLQAQEPRDPYVGIWARLADFRVEELETLLTERRVVRLVVQRGTVHAVDADDCFLLRRLAQPILTQQLFSHQDHGPPLRDLDLDRFVARAAPIVASAPRNTKQLRAALAEELPDGDAAALAFACRNLLPFVQVPPRGLWSRGGEVVGTTAQAWLGREDDGTGTVDDVMLRYLAAFGPSTLRDAATWSRYTALREVFDRLAPQLRTFVDDDGVEYFDLPDAPRPAGDVAAPVRFLPQYDNALLAHADRTRFVTRDLSDIWMGQTGFVGSVLVDGMLRGMWRFDRSFRDVIAGKPSVLTVTIADLRKREVAAVSAEGERLAAFVNAVVDDLRVVEEA